MVGGLFSPTFDIKSVRFGLVEILSIAGLYFVLHYMIDYKSIKKEYYFILMMIYGFILVGEIIFSLVTRPDMAVQTGWGIRNNIAAQLAICMSAPLYLAIKKKASWLFLLIAALFGVSCCATNSRGGSFASAVIFIIGMVIYFKKGDKKKRITGIVIISSAIAILLGAFIIVPERFLTFFGRVTWYTIEESSLFASRSSIWEDGWNDFISNPMFGKGWYDCAAERNANFTYDFMPSRYHNTYIQLMASTGLLGLCAYGYHRYQTIKLTIKNSSLEKTFVFLSISGMLIASLVDCHFFNLGPGLNYAIALFFIESLFKQEESLKQA